MTYPGSGVWWNTRWRQIVQIVVCLIVPTCMDDSRQMKTSNVQLQTLLEPGEEVAVAPPSSFCDPGPPIIGPPPSSSSHLDCKSLVSSCSSSSFSFLNISLSRWWLLPAPRLEEPHRATMVLNTGFMQLDFEILKSVVRWTYFDVDMQHLRRSDLLLLWAFWLWYLIWLQVQWGWWALLSDLLARFQGWQGWCSVHTTAPCNALQSNPLHAGD